MQLLHSKHPWDYISVMSERNFRFERSLCRYPSHGARLGQKLPLPERVAAAREAVRKSYEYYSASTFEGAAPGTTFSTTKSAEDLLVSL